MLLLNRLQKRSLSSIQRKGFTSMSTFWFTVIKKAIVLFAIILFSFSAGFADTFTFFNGVPIGSSRREVETNLSSSNYTYTSDFEIRVSGVTISGIRDSWMRYYFENYYSDDESKCYAQKYSFGGELSFPASSTTPQQRSYHYQEQRNDFQRIESALSQKYGSTDYKNGIYMTLPPQTQSGEDLSHLSDIEREQDFIHSVVGAQNITHEDSQRIVKLDNNTYVYIEHTLYYNGNLAGHHMLYWTMDKETADSIISNSKSINSDL